MTMQQLMGLASVLALLGFVAFTFRGSFRFKDDGEDKGRRNSAVMPPPPGSESSAIHPSSAD
jgi:hypothetical protein